MRRHLALAVAAMLIVLSSSTHSEQKKQPAAESSPQKQLCDAVLNSCVSDCYATLGTGSAATRTCTANCTRQYSRCKKAGKT